MLIKWKYLCFTIEVYPTELLIRTKAKKETDSPLLNKKWEKKNDNELTEIFEYKLENKLTTSKTKTWNLESKNEIYSAF